jgi:hypothetical protein
VHKVQHKPRKKFNRGQRNLEQDIRVCCQVSGAPGQGPNEHATLGFLLGVLCYNSPDCLVCTGHVRWANGATTIWHQRSIAESEQWWTVHDRSWSREVRAHRTWHRTVLCNYRTRVPTVNSLQTPTGVLTWHAPDSEQWLSGVPITSKNSQRVGSKWRL